MDNPRAVTHPGQALGELRSTRSAEQRGRAVRRHASEGLQTIKGALLGVILGAAAVFAFCLLDKQPFSWQTAAWEAALLGLAGIILGRTGGGGIAGTVLFGVAYAVARALRESEYNSIKLLDPLLPLREVSSHADFAMLTSLAICGALIGFLNSLK